jgi:NACHT domain
MPDSPQRQRINQTTLQNSQVQQTQAGLNALSFQNSPNAIVTITTVMLGLFPPRSQPQVDWQWATQILTRRQQPEIQSRLKDGLIQRQQFQVALQEQPQQVGRNPLETVRQLQVGDKDPETLEPGQLMIEVLGRSDIQGRLLILGAPGAGKTTMLLSLAEQLVIGALENPETVIPIIFELSTWKGEAIEDWLVEQLYDNFGGGDRKRYKQWLDQRVLLPLLDGLDELSMERQRQCGVKLNEFALHYPQVVVCCRVREYEAAAVRLSGLQGAVCLQPLSNRQIQDYLTRVGRSELWAAVQESAEMRQLLEPDEVGEARLLRVPLFVAMAAAVYEPGQQFGSKAELLEKYWERQLAWDTRESDRRHKPRDHKWAYRTVELEPDRGETRRYLEWLARSLKRENQTELLLEKMQPSWLENENQIWLLYYRLACLLVLGWICGWINWLILYRLAGMSIQLVLGLSTVTFILSVFGLDVIKPIAKINFFPSKAQQLSSPNLLSRNPVSVSVQIFMVSQSVIFGLTMGYFLGLQVNSGQGLLGGLVGILVGGLFGCFMFETFVLNEEIKHEDYPNQGIINSAKYSAAFAGITIGVAALCFYFIKNNKFYFQHTLAYSKILFFLSLMLLTLVLSGFMRGGGRVCVQHFTLRVILSFNHLVPWHYVRFLKYCTERRLLQQVGGRYRFIHRELLEHLAK